MMKYWSLFPFLCIEVAAPSFDPQKSFLKALVAIRWSELVFVYKPFAKLCNDASFDAWIFHETSIKET